MSKQGQHEQDEGYAQAWVHVDSIGDPAACAALLGKARAAIGALYADGSVQGYQLITIEDGAMASSEQVNGAALDRIARGRYPLVCIRVQPGTLDRSALERLIGDIGCARLE